MAKISIEEALRTKLALPWKIQDRLSTVFLVIRRRPEDLTKQLFDQLKQYGLGVAQIRELFYINSNDWNKIVERLGIVLTRGKAPKEKAITVTITPPLQADKVEFGGKRAGKTNRLASMAAGKLPKVVMDGDPVKTPTAISTPPTLPQPISTKTENTDIHQPTRQEVEKFFVDSEQKSGPATKINFDGWEDFGVKHGEKSNVMIVGTRKMYVGANIISVFAGWERCVIKVRPDGKQVAMIKAEKGFKICPEDNRRSITCAAAVDKIRGLIGHGAEFTQVSASDDVVIFEYQGAAG